MNRILYEIINKLGTLDQKITPNTPQMIVFYCHLTINFDVKNNRFLYRVTITYPFHTRAPDTTPQDPLTGLTSIYNQREDMYILS